MTGLSPLQQQYEWERHNSPDRRLDGTCTACNAMTQWGWCPNCTPIHYKEVPGGQGAALLVGHGRFDSWHGYEARYPTVRWSSKYDPPRQVVFLSRESPWIPTIDGEIAQPELPGGCQETAGDTSPGEAL